MARPFEPAVSSGPNWLKRGIIVGLVGAILVGAVLFAKNTFFSASSGPVTLKYWGLWEPESVMKPLIEEYQSTHHNVTIQYEKRSPNQYRETLLSRLQEGVGPDIFRYHNTWVPVLKNSSTDELAEVPTTVYTKDEFTSTFYPSVTSDLAISGKYYGVPLMTEGLALVYNDDLFKAAGLSGPPATWTDVRQTYVPKLTQYDKDGKIAVAGIALGTSGNVDNFSDILGLLMLQNNVKMIDGGAVTFHKSISADGRNLGADALDFYTLFAKKSFSDKGAAWDDSLPPSTQAFATGRVAMVIVPSFRIFDILDLMTAGNKTFNFRVATVPQALPVGQAQPTYWASYWVEGVAKRSKYQAEAWDFLKFLSSKDSVRKLYTEQAKTRPFGEIPARLDVADALSADRYVAPYLESAKSAKSWYLASGTYDKGIDDGIIAYFADAVNSVLKGTTSVEALTTAAKGASQVLARYGLVQTSVALAGFPQ